MDKLENTLINEIKLGKKKTEAAVKNFLDNQAMKNYSYYNNDYFNILGFFNQALSEIVKNPVKYARMPRIVVNDVPKVVRRTCLLYQKQPDRVYSSDPSEKQNLVLAKTYRNYKEFYRLARTLNTILVRPIWNDKTKQFDYIKLGRHFATVIVSEDNQYEMEELIYPREVTLEGEKDSQIVYFHWTADGHYITDENDDKLDITKVLGEGAEEVNPYGRIPFSVLRIKESDDFWGDGLSTLVNATEQLSLQVSDNFYANKFQFGYPLGVNLNISASEFEVAPDSPIMVENVRNDMVMPDLRFVNADHKTLESNELNDWLRKTVGTCEGLSASSFTQNETALSGYAKTIDNLELLEINNDDAESLQEFEKDLFELMKLESKLYNGVSLDSLTLNEVNFKKYEFPKTSDEIWAEREYKYKYNLESEIDWLMMDRNGLTEDEAMEILTKNRETKIKLGQSRPTLFEQVNTTPNA